MRVGDYEIIEQIGAGAQGKTHLARDTRSGDRVALKELVFNNAAGWESVKRFEREAAVLAALDHPDIPDFVETLQVESENGEIAMYLAQEYIEGSNLADRLDSGELFSEADVIVIARRLLEILVYLHDHVPPVLHRDIKPANIILRDERKVALVDFGAVQPASEGSTVVGTSGYMAPEQLMGRATPRSDLYSLGATLVHLLTRRHPSDMTTDDMELHWGGAALVSRPMERFIAGLVAPFPEDRYDSARDAREALTRSFAGPRAESMEVRRHGEFLPVEVGPKGARSRIWYDDDRMQFDLQSAPIGGLGTTSVVLFGSFVTLLVGAWPFLVVMVVVGVFVLASSVRDNDHHDATALHCDPDALTIHHRRERLVRRIPLDAVAGFTLEKRITGRTAVAVYQADRTRIGLVVTGRTEAAWLAHHMRGWFVLRRVVSS